MINAERKKVALPSKDFSFRIFFKGCKRPAMDAIGSEMDRIKMDTTATFCAKRKGSTAIVIKNVVAPLSCPLLSEGLSNFLNVRKNRFFHLPSFLLHRSKMREKIATNPRKSRENWGRL